MSHLSLVPATQATRGPASQMAGPLAHDLRNILTTVGLHLETLERLAGAHGAKAASAGHALLAKAAALCNAVLTSESEAESRRTAVDMAQVARDVVALLKPTTPDGFAVDIAAGASVTALVEPNAAFRILFNLISNAVTVARKTGRLRRLTVSIEREDSVLTVRVADDGPGLRDSVRKTLFKPRDRSTSGQGRGLAIARELAERSGGTIGLAPSGSGATFVLTLPAFASVVRESPVTRSLGRRVS